MPEAGPACQSPLQQLGPRVLPARGSAASATRAAFPPSRSRSSAASCSACISSSWPRSSAFFPRCTLPIAWATHWARCSSAMSRSIAFWDMPQRLLLQVSRRPSHGPHSSMNRVCSRASTRSRDVLVAHPLEDRLHVALHPERPLEDRLHRVHAADQQALPHRVRCAGPVRGLQLVQVVRIRQDSELGDPPFVRAAPRPRSARPACRARTRSPDRSRPSIRGQRPRSPGRRSPWPWPSRPSRARETTGIAG